MRSCPSSVVHVAEPQEWAPKPGGLRIPGRPWRDRSALRRGSNRSLVQLGHGLSAPCSQCPAVHCV
eukprot:11488518-Alexandrium_andersonii.AAC.1